MDVGNLISPKLWGDRENNNYSSWKEQMHGLLLLMGLLPFIECEFELLPPLNQDEDDSEWKRRDEIAKGCILGALSDEVVRYMAYLDSVRDMWLELENEFLRSELTRKQGMLYFTSLPFYMVNL